MKFHALGGESPARPDGGGHWTASGARVIGGGIGRFPCYAIADHVREIQRDFEVDP